MQYLSGKWKDDHKCNFDSCQQLSSVLFLETNGFLNLYLKNFISLWAF